MKKKPIAYHKQSRTKRDVKPKIDPSEDDSPRKPKSRKVVSGVAKEGKAPRLRNAKSGRLHPGRRAQAGKNRHGEDGKRHSKVGSGRKQPKTNLRKTGRSGAVSGANPLPRSAVKLPKGFAPVTPKKRKRVKAVPLKTSPDKALEEIKVALEGIKTANPNSSLKIHQNKNGSIDGELRVKVVRGEKMFATFERIEQSSTRVPGAWISVGVRFPGDDDHVSGAPRVGGLAEILSYPRKSKFQAYAFYATRSMTNNMAKRKLRKPEEVVVRLHWNKTGERPRFKQMTKQRKMMKGKRRKR